MVTTYSVQVCWVSIRLRERDLQRRGVMFNRSLVAARRLLTVGALALLGGGLQLGAQTTMVVSVPTLQMQKNERIVGFEMRIRSGRIAQLPNVPIGWSFSVDNDPSWNTDVKGSIMVGAAALSADFLRRFVVVETEKDAPSDMPFALEGEVVVTTDFLVQRTIRLSTKDSQTEARKAPASTKPHVQGVSPPSLQ